MSTTTAFGAGGDEPYALMLHGDGSGRLALHRRGEQRATLEVDVADWRAPADEIDIAVFSGLSGPLLDVGCGPGRMVRAAEEHGLAAMGIDISTAAAMLAASDGTPVLRRSVFDHIPLEGLWRSILLMDGNIGIGGDPVALLIRCAELLDDVGVVVVEVDADPELHVRDSFTAITDDGRASAPFPWARVGAAALALIAAESGLAVTDAWARAHRRFVVLRPARAHLSV
jgi:SAM-dependent methyltransferase